MTSQLQFDPEKMKVMARKNFWEIETGIINHWGKIFYVASRGDQGFLFRVMQDGVILNRSYGDDMLYPDDQVNVIDPTTLGVELRHDFTGRRSPFTPAP